jgi:PAS domain S-box-containing protein
VRGPELAGGVVLERQLALEPTLESPQRARLLLREFVEELGRPDWVDAGELAISELVTNAALHGHTPMEVRLVAYPDRAYIEVRDFNSTVPVQRHYDGEATTGRGMALVSAVTSECGVVSLGSEGKVVWFSLSDGDGDGDSDGANPDPLAGWDIDDWGDPRDKEADHEHRQVVLASMPATLWLSARQHHDAILRELVLHRARREGVEPDLAAADRARALISNALMRAIEEAHSSGRTRPALPDGHPSPLPWVPEHLDLCITVPADSAGQFAAMQDVLDVAERLAVAGELLCRPALPEIVAVRDWACEQVIAQLAGIPPSAWPGTAQERFEVEVHSRHDEDEPWDSEVVLTSDRGVIAADESNRIVAVSRSLAELLGWDPAELTGRRVVTVIPPALREGHVAGFSRHLTTGEAHVLGVPLTLPVLRRDGSEVTCRFLVERSPTTFGRSVFLAWIEPAVDSDRVARVHG